MGHTDMGATGGSILGQYGVHKEWRVCAKTMGQDLTPYIQRGDEYKSES